MSADQKQHSGLPVTDNKDILVLYYGIHDALRELGDDLHDAGDGESLGIEHTIAGLWDASSALSRLFEQYAALEMRRVTINGVDVTQHVSDLVDENQRLIEQVQAYEDEINERTTDHALTLRKYRELQEQLQSQQEWIDRVAEFSTDAATAADKAEKERDGLKEQLEALQNKLNEDSQAFHIETLKAERASLKEQLEASQAALQQIAELTGRGPMLAVAIARRALASTPASEPL